jgi:hypothetical protein
MAPRLKILMSSGSKNGTQIYCPFSSKSPGKRIPQVPKWGPHGERYLLAGHFYISQYISHCLSLRVPGKGSPSMFLNRVPTDRDTPSPEPLAKRGDSIYSFIHSFMYVCRSPQKGALPHMGKIIRSPSTELHADGRPTYDGVRPGSQRGSLTTLLSLPQCHAAFSSIPEEEAKFLLSLIQMLFILNICSCFPVM